MSPTQRSLQKLRGEGWLCAIVEHWDAFTKTRRDLFNFGDILAVRGDTTMIIQTTTGDHVSHRLEKIRGIPAAFAWLASPHRKIVIHGWALRGAAGEPKAWTCREVELVGADCMPMPIVNINNIPRRRRRMPSTPDFFRELGLPAGPGRSTTIAVAA